MLQLLHRDAEACAAFDRAVKVPGFGHAPRAEPDAARNAGLVRTGPAGTRQGTAHGPPPQDGPHLAGSAARSDRGGNRVHLRRKPPHPAASARIAATNAACTRKRGEEGGFHQFDLPRGAHAAQQHHGVLGAALHGGGAARSPRTILRDLRRAAASLRYLFDDCSRSPTSRISPNPLPCDYLDIAPCAARNCG